MIEYHRHLFARAIKPGGFPSFYRSPEAKLAHLNALAWSTPTVDPVNRFSQGARFVLWARKNGGTR